MLDADLKHGLQVYLQGARDVLVWKLDGLSEYDIRRPMTPTGSNLLGLIKHLAGAEAMCFGTTFGRPFDDAPALWFTGDAEPAADMWATADETRDQIVDLYRQVSALSKRIAQLAFTTFESTRRLAPPHLVAGKLASQAAANEKNEEAPPRLSNHRYQ